MAESIFKDDVFQHIEDDVEKIRTKPGMYIGLTGSDGALHLVRELADNILDEDFNEESPGDSFEMIFDEGQNKVTAKDNGRGIPFDKVQMLCSYIQSGSKFDRNHGDDSAGENGVGLTAVNALSSHLQFTIYRQLSDKKSQMGIFMFSEGKFLGSKIGRETKSVVHGTEVEMIPSSEILGECQIDPKAIYTMMEKLSYVSKGIPIKYKHITPEGETKKYKFKRTNGILDLVDEMAKSKLIPPIVITGKIPDADIGLVEIAFTFNPKVLGESTDSFMNRINTIDHGVHVTAVKAGIGNLLAKLTNESLTANDKKKGVEVLPSDVNSGLVLVVNTSCKTPGFEGQHKSKVGNKALFTPIRKLVQKELKAILESDSKLKDKLCNYMRKVARARLDMVEVRGKDEGLDSFEASKLSSYSPATEDTDEAELIINEGLSPKGSIMRSRDPRYQAVFALRGVTANVLYMTPEQVLKNGIYGKLVKISGLGIGSTFNLKKSNFKRYILATDPDIDGSRIASGVGGGFFLIHWTPVVEAGMLYRALTPLYMVETLGKKREFFITKAQLYEYHVEQYIKSAQLRDSTGHILTKSQMKDLLIRNKDYQDVLKELYTHELVHPAIIEYVVSEYGKKSFEKGLKERFPELHMEGEGILTGSYGAYQFLMIDDIFWSKASQLSMLVNDYNEGKIYYDYKDKDMDSWKTGISLGEVFTNLRKYNGKILERWKGLGSIPPDIFWDMVLNPTKRTLLRLTVTDLEKDTRDIHILRGSNADLRRRLLQEYKLDKNDIDS